ncbi:hypothetical protein OIU84_025950 [Salix udensis]|uniref:Uncharacterized protein n=1 Tax=Salix udensis TaxID=889485 RepID=A0AAD6KM06_9ROSI|nr:hypothetical protein OIU84_025950 [Salix udensis]
MEIQIISKEIIKPSAPTPHHLRTYKLSAVDQLAAFAADIPIILFYSPTDEISSKNSDHLKRSMAKTLTLFYPFAGRIKDDSSIDCNDEGATYIEAHVAGSMSMILQQPGMDQLEQLQSCKPDENVDEPSGKVMLAAQVNYFDCGGIAISVRIRHRIGDASSLAGFVKCWGAISCGIYDNNAGTVVDCSSLFPPQDLSDMSFLYSLIPRSSCNISTKRFVFEGPKLAALRGKLCSGPYLNRPTRFEAVSALIWGVVGEDSESKKVNRPATIAVDMRKRVDPPLPQHCIGNVVHLAEANWENKAVDYNGLAGKIHESISMINSDYVRQAYADGTFFSLMRQRMAEMAEDPNSFRGVIGFSSWCKFRFYEVDFGWGKPIWVGTSLRLAPNWVMLLDTRDGEGMEVRIALPYEEMVKFEQNPDILAYASFTPAV